LIGHLFNNARGKTGKLSIQDRLRTSGNDKLRLDRTKLDKQQDQDDTERNVYVDGTHGSQPLDLSYGKALFRSLNLLPTTDSRTPLISALLSHMSIKGLRALRLVPSYSPT